MHQMGCLNVIFLQHRSAADFIVTIHKKYDFENFAFFFHIYPKYLKNVLLTKYIIV